MYCTNGIKFRKASINDMLFIFNLSNDELVRKNSFNKSKIEWEKHKKWFCKQIENDNGDIYILEVDNIPVGQIRVQYDNGIGIISYSICATHRGKGYGKKMIRLLEKECKGKVFRLVAYVKKENDISVSVFKKNGYTEIEKKEEYQFWKEI